MTALLVARNTVRRTIPGGVPMDMSATTTIARSPEDVYDYVKDPTRDVNWRTGITDSGMRSDGPAGVGSIGYDGGRNFETVWRVTGLEPTRSVDWEFIEGPLKGRGGYRLEPVATGTRFTLVADVEPLGAMRFLGPVFGWMVRRWNRTDVGTLKRVLESEETPPVDRRGAEQAHRAERQELE